jgi:hypothetical protein
MRERFGQRVEVGSAGENVIVTRPGRITLNDLVGGVAVVTARGEELLRLAVLDVAHPCKPFTGWASGGMVESDVLKAHLQFLEGGTRGFLCSTERSAVISVGDTVALLDGAGRTGKGEG